MAEPIAKNAYDKVSKTMNDADRVAHAFSDVLSGTGGSGKVKPAGGDSYDKVIQTLDKAKQVEDSINDLGITSLTHSARDFGSSVSSLNKTVKQKTAVNAGQYGASSIIGKAKKNLVEFPVFVSSSMSLEYATAINTLLEQVYASYLQMAISMSPVATPKEISNGTVFNKYKTDTSKFLEYTDMSYSHDACHNVITSDDGVITEFDMLTLPDSMCTAIVEAASYQPLSEFDHFFQEQKRPVPDKSKMSQKNKQNYAKLKDESLRAQRDAAYATAQKETEERLTKKANRLISLNKEERDQMKFENDEEDRELRRKYDAAKETRAQAKEARDVKAEYRDREKHAKDMMLKAPQLMDESKIQKLNSLKPLMMSATIKAYDNKNGTVGVLEYIVGVKTHCRLIKADVLPDMAKYPIKEMNQLSKRAKWRAGEIKFFDYLFSRSEKKQAAYDSRDPNKKWYHRLYTLAHSKGSTWTAYKATGSKNSGEGLMPNATIIMTKSDVDNIESVNGIDLLNAGTARRLCNELFLIALVVVDIENESVKMLLPDINNDFEIHSIASINKQIATLDTTGAVAREIPKLLR